VFVAFGGAVWAFFSLRSQTGHHGEITTAWTWLQSGSFKVGLELLVDPLSTMMMLIVSGVGGLIVLYSIGYMDGDDEERRYFAYIRVLRLLDAAARRGRQPADAARRLGARRAVVVPPDRLLARAAECRAGGEEGVRDERLRRRDDGARLLHPASRTRTRSRSRAASTPPLLDQANLVALGLLGGAVAKSAQIPLQTWLPDAMEGPTPVSALIHAATMVTAGVYLIARTHPIFEQARTIELIAPARRAHALVAGLIALVQTDIKRVIAYSTMSQIGYMFVGVGVGAYSNGMFHLMTHAFFKALLFMTAGLAIHALAGEQDIRQMRGIGG
jgi:NADH-quinone oxidoreductase subunit L